jgi:hypothetical protein
MAGPAVGAGLVIGLLADISIAATPRRVCPSMIRAERAAIEMSASSPMTSPAPTAGPAMAETTGLEQLSRL